MQLIAIAQVMAVIVAANGAPVLAKKVLGARWAWPLDGGALLFDGRPVFGTSKTLRGVVLAVAAGGLAGPLVGLDVALGAQIAALAMAGDLMSSFLKRRLNRPPSSQALGLDQVPESLLPLWWAASAQGYGAAGVLLGVVVFFVGELLVSRVLFRLHIRDRPY